GGVLLAEAPAHGVLVPRPVLSGVERADAVHISADVAGGVDGGADARGAVAPVDKAEHHGQIGAPGDAVEPGFPIFAFAAGPFGGDDEEELLPRFHTPNEIVHEALG